MKRIAARVIVFLLLGAIVNIAVAWGCIVYGPPLSMPFGQNLVSEADRAHLQSLGWTPSTMFQLELCESTGHSFGLTCRVLHELSTKHRAVLDAGQQFLSGWPMHSMFGEKWKGGTGKGDWIFSRARPAPQWRNHGLNARPLPLWPLWPGFAINTIFYAAMLWVLFFVPGMVRRRIRRRRGLCPACAYPIGTSPVCTECGAPLPSPSK